MVDLGWHRVSTNSPSFARQPLLLAEETAGSAWSPTAKLSLSRWLRTMTYVGLGRCSLPNRKRTDAPKALERLVLGAARWSAQAALLEASVVARSLVALPPIP